ncbi:CDP-glycerol glycerophosphotransferase family protein [Streptomyces sp. ODS28]|uniref:bifunctional glycosyltransferase/CDP-glycerol:glycerophosphate glycerophosphotransferase n=1 Tax=Streptomyces sp. ODS28 TaxID=3136688 RepID=UPI0031E89E0B
MPLPRFSIITPAYAVQAYLRDGLDSVLGQSFGDFELIAVDDCSPDACGEIIDAAAAADPRITAVHLAENAGAGRARNAGMHYASGDYLLFLDGDDALAPGALRALDGRLTVAGEPDVLLFDHVRTHWNGRTEPGPRSELLDEAGPVSFPLAERPGLLTLPGAVWNRAYRREFLEKHGFSFPPGGSEDVPWTRPTLLAAERIAVLDRVCVLHRRHRAGAVRRSPSHGHFDVFAQYERLFTFVDDHPATARWKPLLYDAMVDDLTALLTSPERLPHGSRAEFFRRSRDHARRYRPEPEAAEDPRDADTADAASGAAAPAPPRGRLLRLGARRAFQLLWRARGLRSAARARARRAYAACRAAVLRGHYAVQRRLPLEADLAVFSAPGSRGYACSPAAVEAKVRELAPHLRTAWITDPEHAHTVPEGVRRLMPGTAAYGRALARGKHFTSNGDWPAGYAKRPGQVHVQTHSGTPVKTMGLDLRGHPAAAPDLDTGALLRAVDRWDFSLSANRHTTLTWERAYPASYTTLEYGYPRNDVLFTATAEDVARIRADLGIPEGATAVLYAPTHRDHESSVVPRIEAARLARALGPGFVLLVRPHAAEVRQARAATAGGVVDVSEHPSTGELCLAADALITDYSSVMFDYANLDRPIVLLADDWETYRATRGTCVDLMETPPGVIARSEEELAGVFATGAWHGPHADELRAAFRARFPSYDDGRAAERVVRRVFLDEDPYAEPAPEPDAEPAAEPAPEPARSGREPSAGPLTSLDHEGG